MKLQSNILKLALFATGLSGIVAEYILSTLATYFLGDSVFQWTMIVSVMMFSMGLGSRLSKFFDTELLKKFIQIEFLLSFLVSFSSLFAYTVAAFTPYTAFIIYALSISIGVLIGMEIPLVIRLNAEFEMLKINVASVIEKDYYGSLVGGVFFAFVGLPYLGLTYTPFILGGINFSVALILFLMLWKHIKKADQVLLTCQAVVLLLLISVIPFFAKPIVLFGEQQRYKDKIIFEQQSRYQRIVITQWKENYWLYINGNQQFSSIDEVMYHEPLVHPILNMVKHPTDVLVLGGGDGCAVREVLKYPSVQNIVLVDLDPAMTELGQKHPVITKINQHSLANPKVKIVNEDGYSYLEKCKDFYDAIIIDLPDPKTVELGRLYSLEFYSLCYKQLRARGGLITQAGSPYYATKAFVCIDTTMQKAGFSTQMMHNQILSFGEWGWVLGLKNYTGQNLRNDLQSFDYKNIKTNWLNKEAMQMITSFGKNIYPNISDTSGIEINTVHNPVLYRYYLKGNWELY
jgi:spermidine synthase